MENYQKRGFAIASLILGILSCTICCAIGVVLGVIGLILGIVSLAQKRGGKGLAIGGVVTSGIGIFVGLLLFLLVASPDFQEGFKEGFQEGYESAISRNDRSSEHEWGYCYTAEDESTIYFFEDGTFDWYRDEDNSDDRKSGNYSVIFGKEAENMLTGELSDYGVTKQEIDDFHDRNSDTDLYKPENLTVLTLETTEIDVEEDVDIDVPYTRYYYGHADDQYFDGVNMDTAGYMVLTKTDR